LKILVLADEESKYLYDYFDKSKLEGVDLIISAGDLNPKYLEFFTSFTSAPIMYVKGNHDSCYEDTPPQGCICIDDKIVKFKNLRIMGLGGSLKYNTGRCQYTEEQMKQRYKKLWFSLMKNKGVDIVVTHAPIAGVNDGIDRAHMGFKVFDEIIDKYHPAYFIHGHVHKEYTRNFQRETLYKDTRVINGYEYYYLEVEP